VFVERCVIERQDTVSCFQLLCEYLDGFFAWTTYQVMDWFLFQVWTEVGALKGLLSEKEAGILYWAAKEWPVPGPVIELGSYKGRSTSVFALAGRTVHAVDAWSVNVSDLSAYGQGATSGDAVFSQFKDNLYKLQIADLVSIHRGRTHQVGMNWETEAAILFIDAGHTYEDVKGDLDIWAPHLHSRGLLLMHDVLGDAHMGVTQAASELLEGNWRVVASTGSIVAFTRS
jgi:predicted O-methyltransferase YrrM